MCILPLKDDDILILYMHCIDNEKDDDSKNGKIMEDFQCDEAKMFHSDENKLSQAVHRLLDEPFLLIVKHISDCNADIDDDCADDKSGSKAPFVLTTKALCWFIDSGWPPGTTPSQSRCCPG